MSRYRMIAIALFLAGCLGGAQVRAGLVTFVGEDLQPNPGATVRTNSDAARASFLVAALAVGPVGTVDFESAPLGSFTNLTVAPGVSVNGTDLNGIPQTIRNTTGFPAAPSLDGSNTTAGGVNFVEMIGGTLTFTFATPTQFFGAYLTGVQTVFFADKVTFNDGTSQTITLAGNGTTSSRGEIAFLGFVDSGKLITSITINAGLPGPNSNSGEDAIGVDDVNFQGPSVASPEPSTLLSATVAGLAGLGFYRRRVRAA